MGRTYTMNAEKMTVHIFWPENLKGVIGQEGRVPLIFVPQE